MPYANASSIFEAYRGSAGSARLADFVLRKVEDLAYKLNILEN